jgi:uncharacterized protein (DUF1800 family)
LLSNPEKENTLIGETVVNLPRLLLLLGMAIASASVFGSDMILVFRSAEGSNGEILPGRTETLESWQTKQASRFLSQATFGSTPEEILQVQSDGIDAWLQIQKDLPASLHRPRLQQRLSRGEGEGNEETGPLLQELRLELWWDRALFAPDQLRQRVAFALSEILVVSDYTDATWNRPVGMAEYYDILVRHGLGNFRQLLAEVSRSPMMGLYLSHLQNQRALPEENIRPDENFAREILQLFSVGLWHLNLDGTRRLDTNGHPIPTYNQDVVENFARVFTGWNYAEATEWDYYFPEDQYLTSSMAPYTDLQDWERAGGYHDRNEKNLLAYPVDGIAPGDWPRKHLPALVEGENAATDLNRALDVIFYHPNVAPFISHLLIQRLVTSNPSPEYVARVARIFNDNGEGVRGDLFATVKAILTDVEARYGHITRPDVFGKLREPLLRQTQLWRALHAMPINSDYVKDWYPEYFLAQAPLRSPSVFNFFGPEYAPPGDISGNGLVAPEFQITNETYVTRTANKILYSLFEGYAGSPYAASSAMALDLDGLIAMAEQPEELLDYLDLLFMGGQMSVDMHEVLLSMLQQVPMENDWLEGNNIPGTARVILLLYAILTSPEYVIQK